MSSLAAIIREFYSNFSIHSTVTGGHFLATWVRGFEYQITRQDVSNALSVPIVVNLIYPYIDPPSLDDVVSVLCGTPMVWTNEPRLDIGELMKDNYLLYRIACHNIFPMSHIHTIPTNHHVFLFSLVTSASMCLPSLFIQSIVNIHRSNSQKQSLFFPVSILRVLEHLGFECPSCSKLVHQISPITATFLKPSRAQTKTPMKLMAKRKRTRVDPPQEYV